MTKLNFLAKWMVSLVGVPFTAVLGSTASAVEYNEIYTPTTGVYEVYKQPPTITGTCTDGFFEQSQSVGGVPIRVVAPATSGTYPVLLLSHGSHAVNTQQAWLADDLAKYGYIVLSIEHRASDFCANVAYPPTDREFISGSNDVKTVLDNLTTIKNSLNASSGRTYTFDTNRIGFVGYSLGAEIGLMKMQRATYLLRREPVNYGDARIKAFFLMAGNLGGITSQLIPGLDQSPANFAQLTQPMFWVAGGADRNTYAKSAWDLVSGAPPGNYYLNVTSIDHFQYSPGGNAEFQTSIKQFARAFFDAKLMDETFSRNATGSTALNNATGYSGNSLNTYRLISNNQPTNIQSYGTPLTINSNYIGYATYTGE